MEAFEKMLADIQRQYIGVTAKMAELKAQGGKRR